MFQGERIASLKSPRERRDLERIKHGEEKEGGSPSSRGTSTREGLWSLVTPSEMGSLQGLESRLI